MQSEILANVIRGETVESIHRGHIVIVDGDGKTIFSVGNPETVTFWRSAAKSFQAIPFILSGAAERFGFHENEIALACASHSGEKIHTDLAAKMLAKAGLAESDLRCGCHLPFYEKRAQEMIRESESPTQLHNNCSGKHAAMLAFAKQIGADLKTYHRAENPVQRAILEMVARFTEIPEERIAIGVDGCNAPNFAVPLGSMARAFGKLILPPADFDDELREAVRRIVTATLRHPELIGGTGRLDTMLMQAAPRQFISKVGADGVYSAGVLPSTRWKRGLGIAFKIEDGDDFRARSAVSVELFRQLGILDAGALPELSPLPIRNRLGDQVGRVQAAFKI